MSAIGKTNVLPPSSLQAAGSLNPQSNGFFTLTISNTDGAVLSVQPDGSWQTRPAGTAGPYELCGLNGNTLVYCPDGKNIYTVPFYASVPNV